MLDAPTVSVLMTSYNRSSYIGLAIESVLASTFGDFELVVVDDGSTDGTQDIVRSYAERDRRVCFYQNKSNLGDYPNRNRAASLARGKWLKYVDSDDYIYPHGLDILVSGMAQFPHAGYGLATFSPLLDRPYPICLSPREAYRRHYFEESIFHVGPLAAIVARSALTAVGGFASERMTSDIDMWHRLSTKFSVVLMGGGIVWYRRHDGQELADVPKRADYWHFRYQAITERVLLDPEVPLTAGERAKIAMRLVSENMWGATRRALKGRLPAAYAYAFKAREIAQLIGSYRRAAKERPAMSASPTMECRSRDHNL